MHLNYIPSSVQVICAVALILSWVAAWLVNRHLGGEVR